MWGRDTGKYGSIFNFRRDDQCDLSSIHYCVHRVKYEFWLSLGVFEYLPMRPLFLHLPRGQQISLFLCLLLRPPSRLSLLSPLLTVLRHHLRHPTHVLFYEHLPAKKRHPKLFGHLGPFGHQMAHWWCPIIRPARLVADRCNSSRSPLLPFALLAAQLERFVCPSVPQWLGRPFHAALGQKCTARGR